EDNVEVAKRFELDPEPIFIYDNNDEEYEILDFFKKIKASSWWKFEADDLDMEHYFDGWDNQVSELKQFPVKVIEVSERGNEILIKRLNKNDEAPEWIEVCILTKGKQLVEEEAIAYAL
ncbi:hypothetical protein GOV10_03025, partial [Candidatus Woesearchaeota archaeon]|nr:hypothetical protein [Candidatus Woesearchaeota archaeon]